MSGDCQVHESIRVCSPETSSAGETEPDQEHVDDVSRDDRTAPSSAPQGSPRPGCSPRLAATPPQPWPKDYGEETVPQELKEAIDESDASLMIHDQKQDGRILPSDTPYLSVRDASNVNSSLAPGAQGSSHLKHAPSVVSDGGDQQWKEGRKQAESQRTVKPQPKDSTTTPQIPKSPQSASRRGGRFQLQAQLRGACQKIKNPMSTDSRKSFLPKKQLYELINPESVARELAGQWRLDKADVAVKKIADAVCTDQTKELSEGKVKTLSYRPVFAILVLIEQPCSIELFMKEGISDLELPLVEHEDPSIHELGENGLYRANKKGEPQGVALTCCEEWSPERRRLFCDNQWMLLSPFFLRSAYNHVNHYTLKDQHLLPFINYHSSLSSGANINDIDKRHKVHGGFSQVFFVHIHSEHHEFNGFDLDAARGFAVKQLTDDSHQADEKFKKEVNMLKKFTGDGAHPHVVSVLATYEQFGKFHLIFHRANGDLFNYWKSTCPSPTFNYDTVVWVAKQLAGLAGGLLRFHRHYTTPKTSEAGRSSEDTNDKYQKDKAKAKDLVEDHISTGVKRARFDDDQLPRASNKRANLSRENSETQYGRHGDLKPENLLWFPDKDDEKGILKITDFGQAELHSENSKTCRESHGVDTLTYRPPEGEIQPRTIRQSSDIWSLGCIYLEFVTWVFGGAEGLQAFKTSRLSHDSRLRMKSDTFFESVPVKELQHEGARLKHSVSTHIENLASRTDCSEYFKDVLGLIREMLVIESHERNSTPNRRKNCGEVHVFLENAYKKCKNTKSYAMGNCEL